MSFCFPRRSLFSPSGQGAGQTFGQQGVYNNMSITVSMAGGSGGAGSLPPMAQSVGNSNLNSVIPVCSDQQVSQSVNLSCALPCVCVYFSVPWMSQYISTTETNITVLNIS